MRHSVFPVPSTLLFVQLEDTRPYVSLESQAITPGTLHGWLVPKR